MNVPINSATEAANNGARLKLNRFTIFRRDEVAFTVVTFVVVFLATGADFTVVFFPVEAVFLVAIEYFPPYIEIWLQYITGYRRFA